MLTESRLYRSNLKSVERKSLKDIINYEADKLKVYHESLILQRL
ncbi:hypothetical protein bcgnr5379_05510 [Bacillus cereus]